MRDITRRIFFARKNEYTQYQIYYKMQSVCAVIEQFGFTGCAKSMDKFTSDGVAEMSEKFCIERFPEITFITNEKLQFLPRRNDKIGKEAFKLFVIIDELTIEVGDENTEELGIVLKEIMNRRKQLLTAKKPCTFHLEHLHIQWSDCGANLREKCVLRALFEKREDVPNFDAIRINKTVVVKPAI